MFFIAPTPSNFRDKIYASVGELEKSGIELLLAKICIEHPLSTFLDPGTALAEILTKSPVTKNIKCLKYEAIKTKIFDQSGCIKGQIDLDELDTTPMVSFLQKILIPYLFDTHRKLKQPKKPQCIVQHHAPGSYTLDVNGDCTTCGAPEIICKLDDAVESDRKLRNLVSHMTNKDCSEFLSGKPVLSDFPQCRSFQHLYAIITDIMRNIMLFLINSNYLTKGQHISESDGKAAVVIFQKIFEWNDEDMKKKFLNRIVSTLTSIEQKGRLPFHFSSS